MQFLDHEEESVRIFVEADRRDTWYGAPIIMGRYWWDCVGSGRAEQGGLRLGKPMLACRGGVART